MKGGACERVGDFELKGVEDRDEDLEHLVATGDLGVGLEAADCGEETQ